MLNNEKDSKGFFSQFGSFFSDAFNMKSSKTNFEKELNIPFDEVVKLKK